MRGEETQLLGVTEADFTGLVCIPGTHSKWISIEAGRIVEFSTYMTGELYSVIAQHSILAHALAMAGTLAADSQPFREGLSMALAEPAARHVRAVIAGEGESRADLERLSASLGVSGRVTWLGRVSDEALIDHLARCRAVCFPPLGEDYGFVTVEAFASRKAVLTCIDSGGPSELVRDGETGLVCDPTPGALAAATPPAPKAAEAT